MKTYKKGTILTNRLAVLVLPENTPIQCIKTHSWTFNSGLSKRTFNHKKGERDRLGYIPLQEKYWKLIKDVKC